MVINGGQYWWNVDETKLTPWSRDLEKLTVTQVSQAIPHLLWNLKVHYHVHKSLLLVPIMSLMTSNHNLYGMSVTCL